MAGASRFGTSAEKIRRSFDLTSVYRTTRESGGTPDVAGELGIAVADQPELADVRAGLAEPAVARRARNGKGMIFHDKSDLVLPQKKLKM